MTSHQVTGSPQVNTYIRARKDPSLTRVETKTCGDPVTCPENGEPPTDLRLDCPMVTCDRRCDATTCTCPPCGCRDCTARTYLARGGARGPRTKRTKDRRMTPATRQHPNPRHTGVADDR